MAKNIVIDGTKIGKGEEVQVNLNIARLPSRTVIDIPVYIHRSNEDGPTVLLLAGLHGDEINSMEILRKMLKNGYTKPTRGSIITIPIFNIYGFLNFSRELPDGKDINRSFPGSQNGSLASRMAHIFVKEILPQIDYGIDYHTGGASRYNYPQIRCNFKDPKSVELGMAFQPPFLLNSPYRPNSLRKEASSKGKHILVYEGGESLRFDEPTAQKGINGTLRFLNALGMTDKNPKPSHKTIVCNRTSWIRAKASGLFHATVESGTAIKKNQIIGHITDPFGDFDVKIKATFNGYIIGVNNKPVINQGDALFHIGAAEAAEE